MAGLIGKKLGMTSIFDESRKSVACTLVEVGPCFVTQLKTVEKDGYNAVQLAFDDKKEKRVIKSEAGHFKKAEVAPKRIAREFDLNPADFKLGDEAKLTMFNVGDEVDVVGYSKGKGFQGVVKRYGFAGVGGQTHGQHNRLRHPGSMGACSFPSRVFKGKRLPGRMGNTRITKQGLKVLKIVPEKNLMVISGSVPGGKGAYLLIEK